MSGSEEVRELLRILSIVGTRPEAIKMAPVIRELALHRERCVGLLCVTGQHRQMLDQALNLFALKPDYDLDLMRPAQTLAGLTASLFERLDQVLADAKPDWVLAQGDTTTVMVAGLVSYYRRVKFGHVEAGLRTGNRCSPFPEEVNRRIADVVADAYFAPTERARNALLAEGVPASQIRVTGNTVIDALLDIAGRDYDWASGPLAGLPLDKRLVVITAHRRESFGAPFRELCFAIRDLATDFEPEAVHCVYPVHLNPNVRCPVQEILAGVTNVSLLDPLDYMGMVHLMKRAALILTDSGGVQEEAPSLRVPVLVMRDTTERPEGIEAGVTRLVGTDRNRIVDGASRLLRDRAAWEAMATGVNPYGDGRAAERVVSALLAWES